MSTELFTDAEALLQKDKHISQFDSRFGVLPHAQADQVLEGLHLLKEQIPDRPILVNKDELHEAELRRVLDSRTISLEHFLRGIPYTLEDVISIHGIEQADLDGLEPWLITHRISTMDAIERLFANTGVNGFELGLSADVPEIRQLAEAFAANQITRYHQHLGRLFEERTEVGNYLHSITPVPSTINRSYFNIHTGRLGLSISAICYELEDGTLQLRERELLRLFGHEGMGHGLQFTVTYASDVPFFLRQSKDASIASEESLTQHYEQVIFDDVYESEETQKALGLEEKYAHIYQEELDTRLINEYNRRFFRYSILVLADKSMGDPRDPSVIQARVERLAQVALYQAEARGIVENNRYNYDSQGNLSQKLTGELRYASQAVQRAFEVFGKYGIQYDNKEQRSHIDMTFLTGYYTPRGFVQKAELAAQGKL